MHCHMIQTHNNRTDTYIRGLTEAQRALNAAYENYIVARSKDDFRSVFTYAEALFKAGTK